MHIKIKAARLWQLAFSIIFISIFVACEDPGSIGSGFVEKSEITIDTILVTTLTASNQDAYTGRLNRSAIGRFQDGLMGDIEAFSLFKPSIQRSSDTLVFDSSTNLSLRLQIFEGEAYGDTTTTGTYSVYRVDSPWRGSSLRNSTEIVIDESEVIGQFSDANVDTNGIVQVDLAGSWKEDYINYFNMADESRDEAYKVGDYGLAIVPNDGNNKILYTSFSSSNLMAVNSDTTFRAILDWGVDLERTGEVSDPERVILHSTYDRILHLDFTNTISGLENKNFVRAELVFKEDTLALFNSLNPGEIRTPVLGLGLILGPVDDIAYEAGFGILDFSAVSNDGYYRFSITSLLNNYLYDETVVSDIYIYLSSTSGSLGYTSLFSGAANQEDAPQLIIYGLESDE